MLEEDPLTFTAHFQLSIIYKCLNEIEPALFHAKHASLIKPNQDVLYNLGFLYKIKKDYANAADVFNRITLVNPNYKESMLYQAQSLSSLGQYDKALKIFEHLIYQDPSNIKVTMKLGKIYYKLNQNDRAISCF